MSATSITDCINTALAIFYQSLTKGEMPTVRRLNPKPDNWPELLERVRGTTLDKFIPMTIYGFDPWFYKGVWLFTLQGPEIMIEFKRDGVNDKWAIFSIECAGPRHRKDFFESTVKCS